MCCECKHAVRFMCSCEQFSIRTALIKVMLFDCGLIICVHSIYDVTLEHIHVIMPCTCGVLVSVFLLLVVLCQVPIHTTPLCLWGNLNNTVHRLEE